MCVKLCQGAEAEVLISELKLCDSSLDYKLFTVTLPQHPEMDIIGGVSSSNPQHCYVSGGHGHLHSHGILTLGLIYCILLFDAD